MSIIEQLSSSMNSKIQDQNIALAKTIVETNNSSAIAELVAGLNSKKIASDCIKVLYEIGVLNPKLITTFAPVFLEYIKHKDNRLQWGSMTALSCISKIETDFVYEKLPEILDAANIGSVITKDHAFNILIELCTKSKYYSSVFPLLNEQLLLAPNNQFPKYIEQTYTVFKLEDKELFLKTIEAKIDSIEVPSKRKRVEKILQKLKK